MPRAEEDITGNILFVRGASHYRFRSILEHPTAALVIENMEKGMVTVNGTLLDTANHGWHLDRNFCKVDITPLVQQGENVVDFTVHMDFRTEIEPAYLVGDFAVRQISPTASEIIAEPAELHNGSWVEQGYPFYPGRLQYQTRFTAHTQPGERTFLRLLNASGILFKVRVNGQPTGDLLWRPHVLELTGKLRDGENHLEIELVASNQNSLGPLHERDGEDRIDCVYEYEPEIREELSLFNFGLLGGGGDRDDQLE